MIPTCMISVAMEFSSAPTRGVPNDQRDSSPTCKSKICLLSDVLNLTAAASCSLTVESPRRLGARAHVACRRLMLDIIECAHASTLAFPGDLDSIKAFSSPACLGTAYLTVWIHQTTR